MRTKLIIVSLLVLIVIAAAIAWNEYRKVCCVEPPADEVAVPSDVDAPVSVDSAPPELNWDDGAVPAPESSPEGLYNDLKAASEDARLKPPLELERVPPPTLPPPTRGEDDDPG